MSEQDGYEIETEIKLIINESQYNALIDYVMREGKLYF